MKDYRRALLVAAYFSTGEKEAALESLSELERLCETYGLEPIQSIACPIKKLDAGLYLGSGKLDELFLIAGEKEIDMIIFDEEITPHQQRNLEKFFQRPVIDRTELIIEVFAQRAHTKEARLQVELAQMRYQFPRLKRMWTHLSRQSASGGGAHLKGEGEKQIEIDRRLLRRRIDRLKKEIEEVEQQRATQRQLRQRRAVPTFAIVGYTNAGKSTLLKALTQADVLVEDKLFATLDTTTRKFQLPNRQEILLVDTVGFIRKIPHMLVAAFKSTLEEAVHTDILLHVIDVSHPQAEMQAEAAMLVLKELGASSHPMITVLNKIDQCTNPAILAKFRLKFPRTVPISALTQEGFDLLLDTMTQEIQRLRKQIRLRIPQSQYALVSEIMRVGKVHLCEYEGDDILLEGEIPVHLSHKIEPFLYE